MCSIEQLADITERYIRGEDVYQISKAVDMPITEVLIALQKVYEQLKVSIPLRFDNASILQLSKLDKAESEAWKSWEMSKRPKQRKMSKATKKGVVDADNMDTKNNPPDKMEQQMNTEEREGSSAYLNIVISCVKIRMDLLKLK